MFKKIVALLIMVSFFYFVGATGVLASNNISVTVKTYAGNSTPEVSTPFDNQARGAQVSITHGSTNANGFAFFAVNDTIRPDLSIDHQFKVLSRMSISVIYDVRDNGEVTEHAVVFVDSNRKIIEVQYVVVGQLAVAPSSLPTPPPNMNWKETPWLTADNKSLADVVDSNRIYYAQYKLAGTVSSYQLTVVGGTGSGSYAYNSVATITPNAAPEGKVFSHWADAEGNKLSYKSSYKVSILAATSVQAVFVDGATSPAEQPVVSMSDDLGIKGSQFVTYKGQMQLPAGYTIVEYGFIFSRSSDVLTLTSLGATIVPSNIHYGVTGEFMRSFPVETFNSIRAYMIIQNGSNPEEVVYSDNYVRNPMPSSNVIFSTTFDSLTVNESSDVGGTGISLSYNSTNYSFTGTKLYVSADSNDNSNSIKIGSSGAQGYVQSGTVFSNVSKIDLVMKQWSGDETSVKVSIGILGSFEEIQVVSLTDSFETYSINVDLTALGLSTSAPLAIKIEGVATSKSRFFIDTMEVTTGSSQSLHEVVYNNEGNVTTQMINNGGLINNNPTKPNFDFDGWYIGSLNGTKYNNEPVTQSMVVYAKFTPQFKTVTFHYNGADGGEMPAIIEAPFGSEIDLPIPTRNGYIFDGWGTASFDTMYTSPYQIPSVNRNMYAKWVINDTGKVALDKQLLSLPQSISTDDPLELITNGANGTTIIWSSNNTNVISTTGIVNLPQDEAVEVTLIATISLNGVTDERSFIIVVNPASNNVPVILRQSDFGTTNSNLAYTGLNTLNVNNGVNDPTPEGNSSWTIFGGNFNTTQWDFVRMGGKAASSLSTPNVYMKTNYTFASNVVKIEVNIVGLDSASGNEKIHLQISTNGTDWTTITEQTITATGILTISGLNIASGNQFRFVFERSSTSSNVGTDIKTITFYGNP